MKQKKGLIAAVVLLVVGMVLVCGFAGGTIRSLLGLAAMYVLLPPPGPPPVAPLMPAVVNQSMAQLLSQHEKFLMEKAPKVYASLLPGLSSDEISALEAKYGVTLPPDLRALYQWRDGGLMSSDLNAFPNHLFIPLNEALNATHQMREEIKKLPPMQRYGANMYIHHREKWIGLFVDGAGDGYYFDPDRSEAQGSFFFNFNETGEYLFYPSIRNYIAQVVQGCATGVYHVTDMGLEIADYNKYQALEDQFSSRGSAN